jgi:hypothetical protein
MIPRLLRGLAIVIAIVAFIDPAITSNRRTKPEIAVVAADRSANELADHIANELAGEFAVFRDWFGAAAATVVAGNPLEGRSVEVSGPVFALLPESNVTLIAVAAPRRSALNARVNVVAHTRVTGSRGAKLEVALHAGDVMVDRVTRDITTDADSVAIPLTFVPTATGAAPLRITAARSGAEPQTHADLLIEINDERWAVLFYDPRPSWMSTFVRRALERDTRFTVDSRVVTSRNISTDIGRPASLLDDLSTLSSFDAIVVGSPDALTERDAAGLDVFLRRRGGGVVLLFDHKASGPFERLAGVTQWGSAEGRTPMRIGANNSGLRAGELLWPAALPAGAEAIARDSLGRAVIWRTPVGAGSLVISGALDAWQYRDPGVSGFEQFWPMLIAETAAAAPAPLDAEIEKPLLEPGASTEVTVTLRDAALSDLTPERPINASVTAWIEAADGQTNLRLWPDGSAGRLRGTVRAPRTPGTYRFVVTSEGNRAETPFVVAPSVYRAAHDRPERIADWTAARGGSTLRASQLDQLSQQIERVVRTPSRRETWHPMRSVWWIIPFVLALSTEWWARRRRGLR